tara:strand:+ start:2217 stop:2357 length:141 start_codon:yes stop_codon:yes gene_type:complete
MEIIDVHIVEIKELIINVLKKIVILGADQDIIIYVFKDLKINILMI